MKRCFLILTTNKHKEIITTIPIAYSSLSKPGRCIGRHFGGMSKVDQHGKLLQLPVLGFGFALSGLIVEVGKGTDFISRRRTQLWFGTGNIVHIQPQTLLSTVCFWFHWSGISPAPSTSVSWIIELVHSSLLVLPFFKLMSECQNEPHTVVTDKSVRSSSQFWKRDEHFTCIGGSKCRNRSMDPVDLTIINYYPQDTTNKPYITALRGWTSVRCAIKLERWKGTAQVTLEVDQTVNHRFGIVWFCDSLINPALRKININLGFIITINCTNSLNILSRPLIPVAFWGIYICFWGFGVWYHKQTVRFRYYVLQWHLLDNLQYADSIYLSSPSAGFLHH